MSVPRHGEVADRRCDRPALERTELVWHPGSRLGAKGGI